MNIIVQSKTLPVTAAIRAYVRRQVGKLSRLGIRADQVFVYLEVIKGKHSQPQACSAKFHFHIPGKDIVVTRKAHDLYAAIADAGDRALRATRKFKEARRDRGHSLRRLVWDVPVAAAYSPRNV